ncbi:LLM class flavin-dependent oxidoreductase [Streptomyces sp. NPDC005811]|uniref:LLM class flavin-dependent oxidoreductase n=1 Tax=Streptomyces sp. NPDC005811 TaxID=3154565 RepID=UPI0034115E5A
MRLALHINDHSGLEPARMAPGLTRIASTAEETGFSRLSLTDHVWQVSVIGEEHEPMLEAYTTLGHLAGRTRSIELQTLVTALTYRSPGLLAKIVTTLDVLSGRRAWLGIGAGWNEQEATGLGLPFGPQGERFARLEETLRICLARWADGDEPFVGEHYQLGGTLNSPQALSRPRPRIPAGAAMSVSRCALRRDTRTRSTSTADPMPHRRWCGSANTARRWAATSTPSRRLHCCRSPPTGPVK